MGWPFSTRVVPKPILPSIGLYYDWLDPVRVCEGGLHKDLADPCIELLECYISQRVPIPLKELLSQVHHLLSQAWDEGLQVVNESLKGLKYHLIIGSRKVSEGLDLWWGQASYLRM